MVNSFSPSPGTFGQRTSETPDADTFRHLASVYADNHDRMSNFQGCGGLIGREKFADGITNGAKWYPLVGKERRFTGS